MAGSINNNPPTPSVPPEANNLPVSKNVVHIHRVHTEAIPLPVLKQIINKVKAAALPIFLSLGAVLISAACFAIPGVGEALGVSLFIAGGVGLGAWSANRIANARTETSGASDRVKKIEDGAHKRAQFLYKLQKYAELAKYEDKKQKTAPYSGAPLQPFQKTKIIKIEEKQKNIRALLSMSEDEWNSFKTSHLSEKEYRALFAKTLLTEMGCKLDAEGNPKVPDNYPIAAKERFQRMMNKLKTYIEAGDKQYHRQDLYNIALFTPLLLGQEGELKAEELDFLLNGLPRDHKILYTLFPYYTATIEIATQRESITDIDSRSLHPHSHRGCLPSSQEDPTPNVGVGFINGINNSFSSGIKSLIRVQQLCGGKKPIYGTYNSTHKVFKDLATVIAQKVFGIHIPAGEQLIQTWRTFFKDHPEGTFVQLCHSQGTVLTEQALTDFIIWCIENPLDSDTRYTPPQPASGTEANAPPKIPELHFATTSARREAVKEAIRDGWHGPWERITIVAVSPAITFEPRFCKSINYIYNPTDVVPALAGIQENATNVTKMRVIPSVGGHGWTHFRKEIQAVLQKEIASTPPTSLTTSS